MKRWNQNCEGFSRRDGLKLGLGGLVGGGLTGALRATAAEVDGSGKPIRKQADACILIWMDVETLLWEENIDLVGLL